MPTEIFLTVENKEPEYETIDESELKEDDEVIEHIHEDAKTEEKENENGEKEVVEVSPAKDLSLIHICKEMLLWLLLLFPPVLLSQMAFHICIL